MWCMYARFTCVLPFLTFIRTPYKILLKPINLKFYRLMNALILPWVTVGKTEGGRDLGAHPPMGTRYSLNLLCTGRNWTLPWGETWGAENQGPKRACKYSQGGCVIPSRFTFPGLSMESDWFPNPRGKLICSLRKLSF